jgi:hypothetical protein
MPDRATVTFRALDTTFEVELEDDPVAAPPIRAILGAYPRLVDAAVDVRYRIGGGEVWRDDTRLCRADDPRDVAPIFELDLYRQVSARAAPGWMLHAAAVHVDGGAIVIAGTSGAGKTTLCLALLARGHAYVTEEIVVIDAHGMIRGLTRPLHLDRDDPRLALLTPSLDAVPYEMVGWTGAPQHHVLVAPDPAITHRAPLPLRALIRVRHVPGVPGELRRLPPPAALMELWGCTLRQDTHALDLATATLRRHPVHELRAPTIPDAVRILGALVAV